MTAISSPVGKVKFSRLLNPKSWEDNPDLPKKYTIAVSFSGEDATKLRMMLAEYGKATKKQPDGSVVINFNRNESKGPIVLVDKDKNVITDHGDFLAKDSEVKVSFQLVEYKSGVSIIVDKVMVMDPAAALSVSTGSKVVSIDSTEIDPIFYDAF